eukprot:GHVU01059628.1.p1 GENE.GHVU01059628.1~~GHVU01059628.1.p1  ORF type:complete len:183 (-),score=3.53 GHVU01059628.1:265-777(-)
MGNSGTPLGNYEAMRNKTDGIQDWVDCLRFCTGYEGHRINDVACMTWSYYADTQQVEDIWGKHMRGLCVTYTTPHGYRRAGVMDSYSGTRFTGMRNCSATCVTSLWSDWNDCSSSCGGGHRKRTRDQLHAATVDDWWDTHVQHNTPYPGDGDCGALTEAQSCNIALCREC